MLMARLQRAIEDSGGPREPVPRRDASPVEGVKTRGGRPPISEARPNRADRRRRRKNEEPADSPGEDLSPIDDGALTAIATERTGNEAR